MKKILSFVFLILASAIVLRMAILNRPVQAAAFQLVATNTEYLSPTPQSTQTIIPSATIGYQDTAVVAQQTAMEAVRVNAIITAEHEQRVLSELQLTSVVESQYFAVQSWTATGALTSIPLTMTQQYYNNTQVANSQSIIAGQLTATKQAPTQMAAIANVKNMEKYAKIDHGARAFFMIAGGLFLLAMVAWFVRNPVLPKPDPQENEVESSEGTPITLRRDRGQGFGNTKKLVVPCNVDQLTELAELAVNGEKRFGINRLERESRTFKSQRDTLIAVREFLVLNELAIKTDDGVLTLNEDGQDFLSQWFETHQLPDGYKFDDVASAEMVP